MAAPSDVTGTLWGPSVEAGAAPREALHGPVGGSYLLVLGPPEVGGVGLCPGAGHGTQVTVQLRLHSIWAAVGLHARLLSRLFLFVLLPSQVLTVGLWTVSDSESSLRGYVPTGHRTVPCSSLAGHG